MSENGVGLVRERWILRKIPWDFTKSSVPEQAIVGVLHTRTCRVGCDVGRRTGCAVGCFDGCSVGCDVGCFDG